VYQTVEERVEQLIEAVVAGKMTEADALRLAQVAMLDAAGPLAATAAATQSPSPATPAPPYQVPTSNTPDRSFAMQLLRSEGLSELEALRTLHAGGNDLTPYKAQIEKLRARENERLAEQARLAYEATPEGARALAAEARLAAQRKATDAEDARFLLQARGFPFADDLTDDEAISAAFGGPPPGPDPNDLAANRAAAERQTPRFGTTPERTVTEP
jgi:hypothetical protein